MEFSHRSSIRREQESVLWPHSWVQYSAASLQAAQPERAEGCVTPSAVAPRQSKSQPGSAKGENIIQGERWRRNPVPPTEPCALDRLQEVTHLPLRLQTLQSHSHLSKQQEARLPSSQRGPASPACSFTRAAPPQHSSAPGGSLMRGTGANWCRALPPVHRSQQEKLPTEGREALSRGRFEDAGPCAQSAQMRASPLSAVRPSVPDNAVPSPFSPCHLGVSSPPSSSLQAHWDNGLSCLALPLRGFQSPPRQGRGRFARPGPRRCNAEAEAADEGAHLPTHTGDLDKPPCSAPLPQHLCNPGGTSGIWEGGQKGSASPSISGLYLQGPPSPLPGGPRLLAAVLSAWQPSLHPRQGGYSVGLPPHGSHPTATPGKG